MGHVLTSIHDSPGVPIVFQGHPPNVRITSWGSGDSCDEGAVSMRISSTDVETICTAVASPIVVAICRSPLSAEASVTGTIAMANVSTNSADIPPSTSGNAYMQYVGFDIKDCVRSVWGLPKNPGPLIVPLNSNSRMWANGEGRCPTAASYGPTCASRLAQVTPPESIAGVATIW